MKETTRYTLNVTEENVAELTQAVLSEAGGLSESEKITAIRNLLVMAPTCEAKQVIHALARNYI